MSLRLRLLLAIGATFVLAWAVSACWMLADLRTEFRDTLDERLASSARMVAALLAESPGLGERAGAARALAPAALRDAGVACDIRLRRGGSVGRTANAPRSLGDAAPGYQTRILDGTAWRSFTLEHGSLRITTAEQIAQREQLFKDVAWATIVPFLVAGAASLGVLWLAIQRGLRPLDAIRHALAARSPEALQPLPHTQWPRELAPLVATVNTLLDRMAAAIDRERRFTGDAAHELRTPLTAIKTHVQVARLAGNGAAAERSLAQAEQAVHRLHRTIDQLLMLARLDGPFAVDGGEQVSALAAARQVLEQFPPAQSERVEVQDEGAGRRTLLVPAPLVVTALRNLLDNALRHGPPGERVTLSLGGAAGTVTFVVTDQGSGLSAQDMAQAAERFWRRARSPGSGLGLSIVAAITARYGGSWALAPAPGGGTAAQVTFLAQPDGAQG